MARVSWATGNPKEAGGKYVGLRTGTVYKARRYGYVAKQTKARHCTEYHPIDAMGHIHRKQIAYPRRSPCNPSRASAIVVEETIFRSTISIWYREKSAAVSVSRIRYGNSLIQTIRAIPLGV